MKKTFSLVCTSWSSMCMPTPTMRKTSESCIVSAAHLLVKLRSDRLFRFSSFSYVTKGVIIICRPPLCCDGRYPRGGAFVPQDEVQWWDGSFSSCCRSELDTQIETRRGDSGCILSFLMIKCRLWFVLVCVCANHFTSDCFNNDGQYRLCLDTNPCKRISPNHTGPSNCTRATDECRWGLIVFTVADEYGEVSWKLAN